jgi:hypothetical protein
MTLIEAMVASAILAVGVVSLTGVAANSVRLHQAGEKKAAALRTLEAQISTIESTPFVNLVALDASTFEVDDSIAVDAGGSGSSQGGGVGGGTISGVIAVDAPTGDASALLEVTISLTWQGMSGPVVMTRRIRRSALGG